MKKTIFFLFILFTFCSRLVLADEESKPIYEFPHVEPEVRLWISPGYIDLDGSKKAGEYQYFEDSLLGSDSDDTLAGGGELRLVPFPHRIYVDAEVLGAYNHFGDFRYAYADMVLSRWITKRLYHNLENITLTEYFAVERNDVDQDYGARVDINKYFVRLKTPGFPLHVYVNGWFLDREGHEQMRFMGGSGYYNNRVRVSSERKTDWETKEHAVGANAHLGPVEADISRSEKRFDPGEDDVSAYSYTATTGVVRPAGTYEHSRIPRFEASTDTVRLHTAYTGGIVLSATFSNIDKKNSSSGALANYKIGHGEVSCTPLTNLSIIGKYRHQETDLTNPDEFTLINQATGSSVTTYSGIKDSIRSKKDKLTGAVRYRPFRGTTVRGEYSWEKKERQDSDAENWSLPTSNSRNTYTLSASSRLPQNLEVKAKYIYRETKQEKPRPVFDFEPQHSNEQSLSVSWTPNPLVSTLLRYVRSKDEKHDYQYVDSGQVVNDAKDRESLMERFIGSFTFLPLKNLSFTPSYTQISTKINQDLVYHDNVPNTFVDNGVEYMSKAHNYSANIGYIPTDNLNCSALVDYTKTHAIFYPMHALATTPVSLASFSEGKTEEFTCRLEGTYEFNNGWGIGMRYRYTDFNDDSADSSESGVYHLTYLTFSKKW